MKAMASGGMKVGPLEGVMIGWYAGEKLGLDWKGQLGTSIAGGYTMKKILQGIAKKGGWDAAIMNPHLQSKIGHYLIKKAPWLAAKMGLKVGAGILAQGAPLVGQAFGIGMAAWTANDIKNLMQDAPEIKQYIIEYLEGEYEEETPDQKEENYFDIEVVGSGLFAPPQKREARGAPVTQDETVVQEEREGYFNFSDDYVVGKENVQNYIQQNPNSKWADVHKVKNIKEAQKLSEGTIFKLDKLAGFYRIKDGKMERAAGLEKWEPFSK